MTSQGLYRLIILVAGLGGFCGMAALHLLDYKIAYQTILGLWGVSNHFEHPFLDISDFFAALECHRRGIDVFLADPCDLDNRPHAYPVLLGMWQFMDFGLAATPYAGMALGMGFIGAVAWIANPRTPGEALVYLMALFSSATAYALKLANMDILIFILLIVSCKLYARGSMGRLIGYGVIYLAGILKFYPVAAMGLLLKEKPKNFLIIGLIFALASVGFLYVARHDLMEIAIPRFSAFGDGIGGKNLREIVQIHLGLMFPFQYQAVFWASHAVFLCAISGSMVISVVTARKAIRQGIRSAPQNFETALFMAGSFIMVSLFLIDVSSYYREVLLFCMLPLLIGLRRDRLLAVSFRQLVHRTIIITVILMWFPFFHYNNAIAFLWFELFPYNGADFNPAFTIDNLLVVLVKEPLWWILITSMMSILWIQLSTVWPMCRLLKPVGETSTNSMHVQG